MLLAVDGGKPHPPYLAATTTQNPFPFPKGGYQFSIALAPNKLLLVQYWGGRPPQHPKVGDPSASRTEQPGRCWALSAMQFNFL